MSPPYPTATALPPTPQGTPRNSSSSSSAPGPRFSVNSNLMNYSIPKNNEQQEHANIPDDASFMKREIQQGNSSTRARQLEAQIETLTLQNVKLQRTNRLLKVDTDNLVKQKTQPLEQTIRELTLSNVQLQRATRLLQQEVEEKSTTLENFKREQIMQMKSVGPEYEYLVQMVNLLHRQISGNATCDDTCCFTLQPINQSTMVMTLPPENEQEDMEAQHICRPVVHSSISQGSYAIELENKILRLEQLIEELDAEKEQLLRQQAYKDADVETLKRELRLKDDIVSQLEGDFLNLEEQLACLQKELDEQRIHGHETASYREVTRSMRREKPMQDPKRQSQLLMDTKRRSLAIKDTDALERMLRGDLQVESVMQNHPTTEDGSEEEDDEDAASIETDKDTNMTTPPRACSPQQQQDDDDYHCVMEKQQHVEEKHPLVQSFLSCRVLPCAYPAQQNASTASANPEQQANDPFAPFTLMTIFLGLASQMGVTDDWTLPITLTVLVSGFLWSGAAKGVQFKVKLK
ncbi:hypothetical protein K492DRAFT_233445 [Lichtheimia hyalospora FSU 10163]|nr:hypothetical protein K492DRAFT_233445 [Lichtheimia hyalospora FSU 10163]